MRVLFLRAKIKKKLAQKFLFIVVQECWRDDKRGKDEKERRGEENSMQCNG